MINYLTVLFQSPFIVAIAVISILTVFVYLYLNRNFKYWDKIGIKGPKPIAVFGNMHSYFIKSQPEVELEWYRKYGKLFGIYIGNKPVIEVAEPELVKQILVKEFNTFRNRSDASFNHKVLSKTLFFALDDDWRRIRAITSPTFTSGKLKKLYSLIKECNDEFMDCLEEYANNGKEIDLKRVHGAYTLDVIAKCAFATEINTHKDPDNQFYKYISNLHKVNKWVLLLLFLLPTSITTHRKIINYLTNKSGIDFFVNTVKHVYNRRKHNKTEKIADFLQLQIDAENNENTSYETDNMAANHLNEGKDEINANIESLKEKHNKNMDKKLNEIEILAQCTIFILAGYEATANLLTFCSYELALHPVIQQNLYEEIKTAFDDNGNIDYDTLLNLPYLDAVTSEALRKYPVFRLERVAMDDTVLGDTGIKIPKGMIAEIPVYAIHYDPENFVNPYQFNPERFLPENRHEIKPYTYLPFGIGPRFCIGMRFGLLEAKLAMANLINRFILSKTPNTPTLLDYGKGRLLNITDTPLIVGIKCR